MNFQLSRSGVAMIATGVAALAGLAGGGGYMAGKEATPPAPAVSTATTTTAAPPPAAPPPAAPAESFVLRVKTVTTEGDAKLLQAELKEKNVDTVIVPMTIGGMLLYAVDVDHRFGSRAEAFDIHTALADKTDTFVVAAPPPPKPGP